MQVEPVDAPLGDMGRQLCHGESVSADSNASLLAIDTQQIAYTLVDVEQEEGDEEREGHADLRQPTSMHESDPQDDAQQPHHLHHHHHKIARSNGSDSALKVMPDMRRSSEFKHNLDSQDDNSDELNSNHHHRLQERITATTTAPTTPAAAAGRASGQHGTPDRSSVLSADIAIWNIVQLLRPSSVMDKQIYMSVGALVLSLVLGTCALCFRDEIFDVTHVNSGLILGSAGTLVMCSVIIGTYLTTKWYRRHMHILLVNLATFDFLLALSFVLEPAWKNVGAGVGEGLTCRWLSIVREYLIMCSTTWTMCMALDLYYLMTDPFTSPRINRRKYQIIAHSSASLGAIIMSASNAFDAPVAVGNFCWVGARREDQSNASIGRNGIWIFIIAPVTLSMGANIFVTFVSYSLLLGVTEVSYQVNQQNILTRDGSIFLENITTGGRSENYSNDGGDDSGGGAAPLLRERSKQSTQCLRTSEVVIGPGFYYIGLIDILQTWNMSKRFERFVKTVILRKDPDGISAMAPKPYRNRFHKKLDEIIHLGHNSITIPSTRNRFGSGTAANGFGERTNSSNDEDDALRDAARSMTMMQGRPTNVLHGVPSLSYLDDTGGEINGEESAVPPPPPSLQGQVRRGSVFHSSIES